MKLAWMAEDIASARRATSFLVALLVGSMLVNLILAIFAVRLSGHERIVVVPPDMPSGNAPKTLADTSKFRVAPGIKKGLVVTVPANGQVKFTASAGPTPDKSDILGATLGTCIWRQEPNTPNDVPYVVYNGSGLTCGTTTK